MTARELFQRTYDGRPNRKTSIEVAGVTFHLRAFKDNSSRYKIEIDNDYRNGPMILLETNGNFNTTEGAVKGIMVLMREVCRKFTVLDNKIKRERRAKRLQDQKDREQPGDTNE
jgi:hypothetical protein